MNAVRVLLALCATSVIGLELWGVWMRGDDLNVLLVIAMTLVILSTWGASRGTARRGAGRSGTREPPVP